MSMLASTSTKVMTGGMKKELVEMEESLQTAVAAAVSQAVRAAVQRGLREEEEKSRKTAEESAIQSAVEAAVRRAVRLSLQDQGSGDRQAAQIAVREAVLQAVAGAIRMRVGQRARGNQAEDAEGRHGHLVDQHGRGPFLNAKDVSGKTGLLEKQLVGLMKSTVARQLGLGSSQRTPRLLQVPPVDGPTSMFDQ